MPSRLLCFISCYNHVYLKYVYPFTTISKTTLLQALKRLKEEIEVLRPPSDDVENFRLLLVGPVGSGKTSFCNTIASVFRGRITQRAIAGESAHSLTAEVKRRCAMCVSDQSTSCKKPCLYHKFHLLNILYSLQKLYTLYHLVEC